MSILYQKGTKDTTYCYINKIRTQYVDFWRNIMWEKINKIMLERNLNMNKLAKLTGINKSHFSDLKSGRIKNLSWTNMVKLADALDISLDEFR